MEADLARGVYKVCGKLWNVGSRYRLHEHIGSGSYGDVCRAIDCQTSLTVALKRVGDVLCCPLLAKRVLREVCIMRRLSHPYVIKLTDVFVSMSMEVSGGIDLYIATEFADGGDMYHMRKPLIAQDVKFFMWQLLAGMSYIHSCRVWHRDIKSENVLLMTNKSVKICDFGLSRSAEESTETEVHNGVTSGKVVNNRRKFLTRQYTKMVVTPSYRAPEVIMSRGQYGSSIDIWSLGCIFWELLIRSLTPNMTGPPLRPLFGVREEPLTPGQGQSYMADGHTALHEQLDVIFDVIGTPGWSDIESVPSESWRSYLKHLPGRAGNLTAQLSGYVDPEALDLLLRMLAFNPSRRCTAEEALSHTYFKGLVKPKGLLLPAFDATAPGESLWMTKDPAVALEILERELEASVFENDGGRQKLELLLRHEIEQQKQEELFRQSLLTSMQYLRQNAAMVSSILPPQLQQGPSSSRDFLQETQDSLQNFPAITARVTRSATAAAAAAAAAANAGSSVQTRTTRNKAPKELRTAVTNVEPPQIEQVLPRRSPRLRDLQAGDLPHRKRLCLKAG